MNQDDWKGYQEGLKLFNSKHYWECHEALEHVWLESVPPTKTFLQALIQAAASLYHVENKNARGAYKLSKAALDKLKPFPEHYQKLPLTELKSHMLEVQLQAERIKNNLQNTFDLRPAPLLELLE